VLSSVVSAERGSIDADARDRRRSSAVLLGPGRLLRYLLPAVPQYKIKIGGRTLPLPPGTHLVGRMSDCWMVLDDDLCSRYHARLLVTSDTLSLEDLESSNGTFLNNERITARTKITLQHGDKIRVGREVISILSDGGLAPTDEAMDSLRKTIGPQEDTHFPQLISQLVQKSLKVGKLKEAERYALALTNQLMGANVPVDHPTAKSCIHCLISLAEKSSSGGIWLNRVFRLHAVHGWQMSPNVLSDIRSTLDRIPRIPGSGLGDYEDKLREMAREGTSVSRAMMTAIAELRDAYGGT
jgi:hypothetical protein